MRERRTADPGAARSGSDPTFIGLDIGTSSTKCALFSASGALLAEASRPVPLHARGEGWVEQDPAEYLASAESTLRAVVGGEHAAARVAGIGVTGQMGTMLALDRAGEPLFPGDTTLDTRCDPFRDQALARDGDLILDTNGALPYTAPKLLWWRRHAPDLYRRIRAVVMPHSFVAMRLAGLAAGQAIMDRTCIGLTGVGDIRRAAWSPALCDRWGIDASLLPRIAQPSEVVGSLRPEAARRCGLRPGIPLIAGCGDAVAGWLGVGAVDPGVAVDTAGTSNHFSLVTRDLRPDSAERMLACFPSALPDLWHVFGYCADAGVVHRWFAREFASAALEPEHQDLQPVFAALDAAAMSLPAGSDRLLFVPHLSGRVCPRQPDLRGSWIGFSWRHRREHFYRAMLESIAYEYALYLRAARRLQPDLDPRSVRLIGGGARSGVWTQIKADVLGLDYLTMPPGAYSCLGVSLLAGQGVGYGGDLAARARTLFRPSGVVAAVPQRHRQYAAYVDYYADLLRDLQQPCARLRALPA